MKCINKECVRESWGKYVLCKQCWDSINHILIMKSKEMDGSRRAKIGKIFLDVQPYDPSELIK